MSYKQYIQEEDVKLDNKKALAIYISNNLFRLANDKSNPKSIMILVAAATILNSGNDAQTLAAARRLAQIAISRSKMKG